MRPKKQVFKNLTQFNAGDIIPINPSPIFQSNTVNVRIARGGFFDDENRWHKAPKRSQQPFREAVKLNGIWYWAASIRDKNNNILIPNELLYSKKS